ncbi:response regulator [Aequorivita sp. F47161]|uniref:Response regulator n=1 Tax=Aequorivita vitellina TaxID=2874475 RepID=A0A9X1QW51_9FLAO|nr:response regulator [Aequorivita vitellina]MCG2418914.1 response regulator [Aequorivita vitellina]MCZ4320231.1 response regulator [Aequorivita viscosa]
MNLPSNLNFLLVEDLVSDTFLLQRQLKKISHNPEIRFVDSEISLINALKTYIPDIVITDFNLVGMNAFDVIRIIKNYNDKIPVVVITGNLKYEADKGELLKKGAKGFFLKEPINTLNERLAPLFKEIIAAEKEKLDRLSVERRKYATNKSNSDFLRQYTFGTNETAETKAEAEETKSKSVIDSIRNFFRK